MSDYSQNVFFAPKDALSTGDPNKVIKGSEIDAELQEISDAIATKVETGSVPSGTKMIMVETSAPSGWTLNTAYDDRTILISDGPTDDGTPDTGGTWTLTSDLSIPSGGSHTHTDNFSTGSGPTHTTAAAGAGVFAVGSNGHTHAINGGVLSGNSSHTHSITHAGTWRPNYVEAIVCEKD